MKAAYTNSSINIDFNFHDVLENFFKHRTPETTNTLFWKFFQCWALKDCKIKAEISDEEVALFFDQLIDLVAAAYIVHQANRVFITGQEGEKHD